LTCWDRVDCELCDVEVEVVAGAVVVFDAEVEVLEDGATLEVVVSEETPADCVAVELPPQPAIKIAVAMAARKEAVGFVGIGRSAYSTSSR